jgi:hypothetical protein
MNLTPEQAQTVVQDVATNGQMGSGITNAIRSNLSTLTLPGTGGQLDDAGLSRAVANLERAAQALVSASNTLGTDATSTSSSAADNVTAGSSTPIPTNYAD